MKNVTLKFSLREHGEERGLYLALNSGTIVDGIRYFRKEVARRVLASKYTPAEEKLVRDTEAILFDKLADLDINLKMI